MAQVISIKGKPSKGLSRPGDVCIILENGDNLGLVQSVSWSAAIGEDVKCHIQTVMTEAELEAYTQDAKLDIKVRVMHPCWFCKLKYKIKNLLKPLNLNK